MPHPLFLVLAACLASSAALADRGAFSVDLGGGLTGLNVPAPYSRGAPGLLGLTGSVVGGARYALSNNLELAVDGFFHFPETLYHDGITIVTPQLTAPNASLAHSLTAFGVTVGPRLVLGDVFRLTLGVQAGWGHRLYGSFDAVDSHNIELGLALPSYALDSFLVEPLLGVEWAFADRWSLSILPRAQLFLGNQAVVGVLVPLTVSWSKYLFF